MGVYAKLLDVQTKLKAPKGQYNNFGKYKYRSCEDILEALKPVLKECNATVNISDEITTDAEWHYIKAVATFTDIESGESVTTSAYARESKEKKGMDESQITGSASSYARKYALNGMFLIDDTKDEDTNEKQAEKQARAKKAEKPEEKTDEQKNEEMKESVNLALLPNGEGMTQERIDLLMAESERTGVDMSVLLSYGKVKKVEDLNENTYLALMRKLAKTKDKA